MEKYLFVFLLNLWLASAKPTENISNGNQLKSHVHQNEKEENLGQHTGDHVSQGDIMFRLLEEEILFGKNNNNLPLADIVRNANKHWKLPIPYVFHSTISNATREVIKSAFKEYGKRTCITFKEKEAGDKDYIKFIKSIGCWSYVGKSGGKQHLSIGKGCDSLPTVCHEIMHALGFFHEQSRPDRDKYVKIIYENIKKGSKHNFAKQNNLTVTTLDHPYDYESTMHYQSDAFSKNRKVTIKRLDGGKGKFGIQDRKSRGLSDIDAQQLNALYCKGKSPSTTKTTTTTTKATTSTTTATESATSWSTATYEVTTQFDATTSDPSESFDNPEDDVSNDRRQSSDAVSLDESVHNLNRMIDDIEKILIK